MNPTPTSRKSKHVPSRRSQERPKKSRPAACTTPHSPLLEDTMDAPAQVQMEDHSESEFASHSPEPMVLALEEEEVGVIDSGGTEDVHRAGPHLSGEAEEHSEGEASEIDPSSRIDDFGHRMNPVLTLCVPCSLTTNRTHITSSESRSRPHIFLASFIRPSPIYRTCLSFHLLESRIFPLHPFRPPRSRPSLQPVQAPSARTHSQGAERLVQNHDDGAWDTMHVREGIWTDC